MHAKLLPKQFPKKSVIVLCFFSTGDRFDLIGLEVMVINVTINDISVISWQSVSLVEETGVPGENH